MQSRNSYPDWFVWLWQYSPLLLLAMVVLGGILFAGIYTVDSRLSDIEDQLLYEPPRSYKPPDLTKYSAGSTSVDQLTHHHQVYVPVYSHIYYQGGSAYALETTLSIRNVSSQHAIFIESVEYYDTSGKRTKTQVDALIKLEPLETIEFLIERRDSSGGSGANYLVRWGAMETVDKPLIETIMVGTAGTQGISFSRTGVEVDYVERSAHSK